MGRLSIHPITRATRRPPFGITRGGRFMLRWLAISAGLMAVGIPLGLVMLPILGLCGLGVAPILGLVLLNARMSPLAIEVVDGGLRIERARGDQLIPWPEIRHVALAEYHGSPMTLVVKLASRAVMFNVMPFEPHEITGVVATANRRVA